MTASVLVALFIGGLGTPSLLAKQLGLSRSLWEVSDQLNGSVTNFGYAVAGIFTASWAFSVWVASSGSSQNLEEALLKVEVSPPNLAEVNEAFDCIVRDADLAYRGPDAQSNQESASATKGFRNH